MTILTATHLLDGNLSFSKKLGATMLSNGAKKVEGNGTRRKLEFIHDGVLKPPNYGPHIIRLTVLGKSPKRPAQLSPKSNGSATATNSRSASLPKGNGNDGAASSASSPHHQKPKCSTTTTDEDDHGKVVSRLANKRKRILSERFHQEAQYPVVERSVAQLNTWKNCHYAKTINKGLAGIHNPHNNCFLNSVIQSVCHIPQFMRYAIELHKKEQKCAGLNCLLCRLSEHFLRASCNRIVNACWIFPRLSEIFPNHLRGTQEDAHEMLLFLLDAIDRQQQHLRRSQPGRFSSIVEQVFDGKTRCEYKCAACDEKSICYEPVRGFNVELRRNNNKNSCPTISQVVHEHFREERITSYSCRKCQKQTTALKCMRLVTAPNILILQLKRFHRFSKNSAPVIASLNFDITKLMYNGEATEYHLLGYIKHIGSHMSSGHYIAAMAGFDGKSSFYYDDESNESFELEYKYPTQPYVLFYSKTDPTFSSPASPSSQKPVAKKARYHDDADSKSPSASSSKHGRRNGSASTSSSSSSASNDRSKR